MNGTVKVRVVRPLLMHGQRREIGDILNLAAAEAAIALETGRGALLDPADASELQAARRAEVADQMRKHGRQMVPPGDGPWQRVN
jgi:hypothetical protein